jgi:4a-hydroxytetrahydrobiopterin dehydratase
MGAIMAQRLTDSEIQGLLQEVPGWTLQASTLTQTFKFKDFLEAMAFVNRLVEPSEAAGHHPDISISYNTVAIALTTHDAGGLTQRDFDLAKTVSQIA